MNFKKKIIIIIIILLLYGRVSKGLETTKFKNLIG